MHTPASSASSPRTDTRDTADLSLGEASRRIERGELTAPDLMEAVLARIDALDDDIHSYLRFDAEAARAKAHESAARARDGRRRGPMDGIPFAVKDTIYTRSLPTTAGSRVPQTHAPALQSHLVDRLEAAGAILVGKSNTWEYGTGTGAVHFDLAAPPARNPWNHDHFTGGSSSGSAAAVAAGTATFAIGTDTGGSVRLPASACGIVGFKPTFGRISRHGVMPNCWSFDTVGPMTLTVEDAALVYEALAGHDAGDPTSSAHPVEPVLAGLGEGVRGLRIGYVRYLDPGAAPLQQAVRSALDRAAALLAEHGALVEETAMPLAPAAYRSIALPINRSESFSIHEADFLEHRHLMGRALREKLEAGLYMRAADYLAALRYRREIVAATDALFDERDALLLPMTTGTAPPFADETAVRTFTTNSAGSPFSLTGHPALSLPFGFDGAGLPLAVQLASGFGREGMLLRIAATLEAVAGGPAQRAPFSPLPEAQTR